MKKLCAVLISLLFLTGCGGTPDEMHQALALRSSLLQGSGCSFFAEITADYGDVIHQFSLDCQADQKGAVTFGVTRPEAISGVTGEIRDEQGRLTFDGTAVCFELLADGQLSPVSSPWLLVRILREGYLHAVCREGETLKLTLEEECLDGVLLADVWVEEVPVRAEFLYEGRRILTMDVKEFVILQHSAESGIG